MTSSFPRAGWVALGRIRALGADARGAIAPMAAILILPLAILAFGAVEFHRYTTVRSNLQAALDSAALAIARSSSNDLVELQRVGEAVLRAQVPFSANLRLNQFTVSKENGRIVTYAEVAVSPIVASMIISGDLTVRGQSEVAREISGLEVALVMDNTGSMYTNNRIGIAREAATNFVLEMEGVAAASTDPQKLRISVVPFAGTVNVGPSNASATWLDQQAASPVHSQIFSTAMGGATSVNRFSLLQTLGIPWGGCVESRPMPYDVQDTPPAASTPGTLFVPYFAPDGMDYVAYRNAPANSLRYSSSQPLNSRFHNMISGLQAPYPFPYNTQLQPFRPNDLDFHNDWLPDISEALHGYNPTTRHFGGQIWNGFQLPPPSGANGWEDYRNAILHAPTWTSPVAFGQYIGGDANTLVKAAGKYTKAKVDAEVAAGRFDRNSKVEGPNAHCNLQPITRLTSDMATVKAAVGNMQQLARNTNVPMGLMWGWHTLSPNTPLGDGRPYGTKDVTKIIIVMTDGENDTGQGYSGVGHAWQKRLGDTDSNAEMNTALNGRMPLLCDNVKARGIVIYTVRVEVAGGTPDILRNCATEPSMFYDVKSASELTGTFRSIAKSIQYLRIAH